MIDLSSKVAIVTGSSRGIGAGIALQLARLGARVVINHRNSGPAAQEVLQTVQAAGGEGIIVQGDVSLADDAQRLVKETLEAYDQVDILVNNAGITRDNLIMRMKDEEWEMVLKTNLTSAYHCSKAVIRPMMRKRWGRIINISSIVGLAGQEGQTNYAASKAGLIGFSKSLAREIGSRQITVNVVAPGFVPTALTEVLPEEQIQAIIKATPLGKMGTVEDVAYAVAFLASEEAGFITGQILTVDGGLIMQ